MVYFAGKLIKKIARLLNYLKAIDYKFLFSLEGRSLFDSTVDSRSFATIWKLFVNFVSCRRSVLSIMASSETFDVSQEEKGF